MSIPILNNRANTYSGRNQNISQPIALFINVVTINLETPLAKPELMNRRNENDEEIPLHVYFQRTLSLNERQNITDRAFAAAEEHIRPYGDRMATVDNELIDLELEQHASGATNYQRAHASNNYLRPPQEWNEQQHANNDEMLALAEEANAYEEEWRQFARYSQQREARLEIRRKNREQLRRLHKATNPSNIVCLR